MKTQKLIYWVAIAALIVLGPGCDTGYEYEEENRSGSLVPETSQTIATQAIR